MASGLIAASSIAVVASCAACYSGGSATTEPERGWPVIRASEYARRPPFAFNQDDAALLDDVQRGAFNFLWNAASPHHGMVVDRTSVSFASVAGVGFQLAAIPVGVERGWIDREEGRERVMRIVRALRDGPGNRHEGLFYHYLDGTTALPADGGPERVVSTIDSALLFAGMMVASSYFGGDVAEIADRLIDDANWRAFVSGGEARAHEQGFIALGWRPEAGGGGGREAERPSGYLPYYWVDSGDEHRLVAFLAVGAARPEMAVEPALYYRLRREVGDYRDTGPFVWFPWSGALFTSFFAHAFIDYAHAGVDDPAALGVERRPRVDWWENARRTVRMHQLKAEENPRGLRNIGRDSWGLNASDCPRGYCVYGLFPKPVRASGERPGVDFEAGFQAKDEWGDGTIAPYSAGCSILFDPERALAAMRRFKGLRGADGRPLVWRDPEEGGFGFLDAFNVAPANEQGGVEEPWAAKDCLAIDQGPLILCIENARTGLVSGLFMRHPVARRAVERLRWR